MAEFEPTKRDYQELKAKYEALEAELKKKEEQLKLSKTDSWRKAGLIAVRAVRHQVFDVCLCKSKAYLKYCERYSCRHVLSLIKNLDNLAVQEGVFQPMRLHHPRFRDEVGVNKVNRQDFEWETEALNPDFRDYDEQGHAITVGRGHPMGDSGPNQYSVKAN